MTEGLPHWYPPGDISFHRDQVIFLIEHLPILHEGLWPPEPDEYLFYRKGKLFKKTKTTYIAQPSRPAIKPHAYFETPCQFAAEIERRLESCGADGLIVKAIHCWKETAETMANHFNTDEITVTYRVNAVLWHISRWSFRTGRYRRRDYKRSAGLI